MKYSFLLVLLFFLHISSVFSNGYEISQRPKWIKYINPDFEGAVSDDLSYYYQLIDNQDNIAEEHCYRHYSIKILNTEGLQSFTSLDFNFDPSFQKLVLHSISVIRNGSTINKLLQKDIKVIQREKNLERSFYDGSLNVILDLKDLRIGDVIDYDFSIIGFNPVIAGNYSSSYYLQYTFPVKQIHCKVLYKKNNPIKYKLYNSAPKPKKAITENKLVSLEWNQNTNKFKFFDSNVPYWLEIHPRVVLSTYNDWEAVVNTFAPYYKYEKEDIIKIKQQIRFNYEKEHQILSYIKLVQDDIRYLGFESGIGAYAPNNPFKVFSQKYGDCKDKSLLLVSLLRTEGLEAYPCLVNTKISENIFKEIPSSIFNHCIVYFKYSGKEYFVDPTINNQGGDLMHMNFPDYKAGLILKSNVNELIKIPKKNRSGLDVSEIFECDSVGGSATYFIRTKYFGNKADNLRSSFKSNSISVIQNDYLNYYNGLYNNVQLKDSLVYYDSERLGTNEFIIEESYFIDSFWSYNGDSSILFCSIEPYILTSDFNLPSTAKRSMPYQLGPEFFFKQRSMIILPEEWNVSQSRNEFKSDGFYYIDSIYNDKNIVFVDYYYEQLKEYLSPNQVKRYINGHENIIDNSTYHIQKYLTYNAEIDIFYVPYMLLILMLYLGVKYSFKLNKNYDPKPWKYAENKPIGGIIILPAIGVVVSPFYKTYQTIKLGFFNPDTWNNLINSNVDNKFEWLTLVGLEQSFNILLIIFSILIAIQFFQRRTSIPLLISIYYFLIFIIPILDQFLSYLILPEQYYEFIGVKEYVGPLVAAAIWIPVFRYTEIVKSTFCKQLN